MIKIKTGLGPSPELKPPDLLKPPDYCSINCANNTRNVDNLLDLYKETKEYILSLLQKNPAKLVQDLWKPYTGLLCSDSDCKCRVGTYDQENVLKSYARCVQCTQLGRITDFNYNIINRPFKVNAGKLPGRYLVLEQRANYVPEIRLADQYRLSAKHITEYYQSLSVCDSIEEENIKYLISDPMTNNFLISLIINGNLKGGFTQTQSEFVGDAVNLHTIYQCGSDGYTLADSNLSISEYVAFLDNADLPVKEIWKDLIQVLDRLTLYNFMHNNPTIKAIQFDLIEQKIKLCNFEDSSLKFGNLKLLSLTTTSNLYIKNEPIYEEIESQMVGDNLCYSFNYETGIKILHLRRLGVCLYNTSFTLYCFLIALMSQPEFYRSLNPEAWTIWKKLWRSEEYDVLDKRLKLNQQKTVVGIDDIIQTLTKLSLRCDVLKYMEFLLK